MSISPGGDSATEQVGTVRHARQCGREGEHRPFSVVGPGGIGATRSQRLHQLESSGEDGPRRILLSFGNGLPLRIQGLAESQWWRRRLSPGGDLPRVGSGPASNVPLRPWGRVGHGPQMCAFGLPLWPPDFLRGGFQPKLLGGPAGNRSNRPLRCALDGFNARRRIRKPEPCRPAGCRIALLGTN